jgi:hypothetical protein
MHTHEWWKTGKEEQKQLSGACTEGRTGGLAADPSAATWGSGAEGGMARGKSHTTVSHTYTHYTRTLWGETKRGMTDLNYGPLKSTRG